MPIKNQPLPENIKLLLNIAAKMLDNHNTQSYGK